MAIYNEPLFYFAITGVLLAVLMWHYRKEIMGESDAS